MLPVAMSALSSALTSASASPTARRAGSADWADTSAATARRQLGRLRSLGDALGAQQALAVGAARTGPELAVGVLDKDEHLGHGIGSLYLIDEFLVRTMASRAWSTRGRAASCNCSDMISTAASAVLWDSLTLLLPFSMASRMRRNPRPAGSPVVVAEHLDAVLCRGGGLQRLGQVGLEGLVRLADAVRDPPSGRHRLSASAWLSRMRSRSSCS